MALRTAIRNSFVFDFLRNISPVVWIYMTFYLVFGFAMLGGFWFWTFIVANTIGCFFFNKSRKTGREYDDKLPSERWKAALDRHVKRFKGGESD